MAYILYSGPTSETGRLLKERLNIHGGTAVPRNQVDVLIRWGSTEQVPNRPRRVINKRDAILLASDKVRATQHLRNNGVTVPDITLADDASRLAGKIPLPALGRKRHHTQGTDIILCLQSQDVRRAINRHREYFVKYIPTEREYRLHIFNGQIIRSNQKFLEDREAWVPYIRNYENGYVYGRVHDILTPEQENSAINAVRLMGLDFGAVDLVISDDGLPFVLEVNTGPALIDVGLDIYVNAFQQLIPTLRTNEHTPAEIETPTGFVETARGTLAELVRGIR